MQIGDGQRADLVQGRCGQLELTAVVHIGQELSGSDLIQGRAERQDDAGTAESEPTPEREVQVVGLLDDVGQAAGLLGGGTEGGGNGDEVVGHAIRSPGLRPGGSRG